MAYVETVTFDAASSGVSSGMARMSVSWSVSAPAGSMVVALLWAESLYAYPYSSWWYWLADEMAGLTARPEVAAAGARSRGVGWWSGEPTGDPTLLRHAVGAWVLTPSGSDSWSNTVSWLADPAAASGQLVLVRYSGGFDYRVAYQVLNAQPVTYPGVSTTDVGNTLRVAVGGEAMLGQASSLYVPAGHTLRASTPSMVVSDQASASAAVSASGTRARYGISLVVRSTLAPEAPAIVAPLSGSHDLAAGFTLSWDPDGDQAGVRVTRRLLPSGATQYLTSMAGNAWSTTATTLTTTESEVTFPAGQWNGGGARYEVTVRTTGPDKPALSPAATVTWVSWQPPSTTGVTVSPVSGSQITSRVPTVTVTGSPGAGTTVDGWQWQALDGATVVYDSGTMLSDTGQVPVSQALPHGVSLVVRGRVRQAGSQWSAWVSLDPLTVHVPPPAAPVLTVAAAATAAGMPGLEVTVSASPGTVALYRDGELMGEYLTAGTLIVSDYLAAPGAVTTYTATVTDAATPPNTSPLSAPASGSVPPTSPVQQWMLDPQHPDEAVAVYVHELGAREHDPRVTTFQPVDSPGWLVHTLGRVDAKGAMSLHTLRPDETEAALALLTSGRLLTLRLPGERDGTGWVGASWQLRFRVAGVVSEDRVVQQAVSWRRLACPYVEQHN